MLFSKFSFVAFSIFIANYMGENSLSYYVYILNLVAALSSLSMIPIVPNILGFGWEDDYKEHNGRVFISLFIALVLLFLLYLFYVYYFEENISNFTVFETLVSVCCYMFGLFFGAFSIALYNQRQSWIKSGLSSLLLYFIPVSIYLLTYIVIGVELKLVYFFVVMFVCSIILFYFACSHLSVNFSFAKIRGVFEPIKNGLYGFMFLVGLFSLNHFLAQRGGEELAVLYSWTYLIFSTVLFIPSILGSFVVPIMSNPKKSNKFGPLFGGYFLFSLLVGLSIYFLRFFIMNLYGISDYYTIGLDMSIVLMLVASVLAVISAFFIQYFLSLKAFKVINLSVLIWFVIVLVCCFLPTFSLIYIYTVLILAYSVLVIVFGCFYLMRKNQIIVCSFA